MTCALTSLRRFSCNLRCWLVVQPVILLELVLDEYLSEYLCGIVIVIFVIFDKAPAVYVDDVAAEPRA